MEPDNITRISELLIDVLYELGENEEGCTVYECCETFQVQ